MPEPETDPDRGIIIRRDDAFAGEILPVRLGMRTSLSRSQYIDIRPGDKMPATLPAVPSGNIIEARAVLPPPSIAPFAMRIAVTARFSDEARSLVQVH